MHLFVVSACIQMCAGHSGCMLSKSRFGGEGGDRTHGPVARTAVFETARFGHSRTSPRAKRPRIITHLPAVCKMHDFARNGAVVNSVVEFSGDPLDDGGFMTGA